MKLRIVNSQIDELGIITAYRYLSLIITSLFYYIENMNKTNNNSIVFIIAIIISSIILNYLYSKNVNIKTKIIYLALIETVCNSAILIPTGGLDSPYVWYSLNTILITSIILGSLYCWINIFTYLLISGYVASFFSYNSRISIISIICEQANLILCFILIIVAIRLLSLYINEIKKERLALTCTNEELMCANEKIRESFELTMELYRSVQLLNTVRNKKDLIKSIIEYTEKITKSSKVIFYKYEKIDQRLKLGSELMNENYKDDLRIFLEKDLDILISKTEIFDICFEEHYYQAISLKSDISIFGILCIETCLQKQSVRYKENAEQLKFISGLSAIMLEKFEMEIVNERLIVTQEQNRIANEIHDSVLQRLFSSSFGLYAIIKNINTMTIDNIYCSLEDVRKSINNTMRDLRIAVYGLSWKKEGSDTFMEDLTAYIDEIKNLNNIRIDFDIYGNKELLTLIQKKALYRIICESISNGIRHGSAKYIKVSLDIETKYVTAIISDDGKGFSENMQSESKQGGVGLKNIQYLTDCMGGSFELKSNIGVGTNIQIKIPMNRLGFEEEQAV